MLAALFSASDLGERSLSTREHTDVRTTTSLGAIAGETTFVSENYPVEFSVQPAEGIGAVICQDGIPQTDVFFFVNPPNGGVIEIAPEGAPSFFVGTDHGPLKNGTYQWRGTPFSGFTAQGVTYGAFTLSAVCPEVSAVGSVSTASNVSLPTLSPPEIYANGIKVSSGAIVGGDVLLVVKSQDVQSVAFVVMNGDGMRRTFGMQEGVVENPPGVWGLRLSPSQVIGTQTIFALGNMKDGTTIESPSISITIEEVQSVEYATTGPSVTIGLLPIMPPVVPIPPRPQLKFFVDEKPLDITQPIEARVLELRVIAPLAQEIYLFVIRGGKQEVLGRATKDDLLSLPGTDVWSYVWERDEYDSTQVEIFARANYADDRVAETPPIMLSFAPPPTKGEGAVATSVMVDARTEKEQILARVTDPGLCMNANECRIYCEHLEHSDVHEDQFRCADFARTERPGVGGRESLASGISSERIARILADPMKRPKWLPERISSAELFERYCADPLRANDCKKFLVGYDLASPVTLEEKAQALVVQAREEQEVFHERVGARVFLDTDGDGISDYDEINIYRTDPFESDTDGDSVGDGAELLARTNPNGRIFKEDDIVTSDGEMIQRADAFVDGIIAPDLLNVERVEAVPLAVDNREKAASRIGIAFSGNAPPASFVSIFIYSDPIVVVVRTDESGQWSYTLEKELPDGTHTAWTAITDGGGRIIVKSEPFSFVKTAQAVTIGAEPVASASSPSLMSSDGMLTVAALAVALFGVLLAVVGFVASHRRSS